MEIIYLENLHYLDPGTGMNILQVLSALELPWLFILKISELLYNFLVLLKSLERVKYFSCLTIYHNELKFFRIFKMKITIFTHDKPEEEWILGEKQSVVTVFCDDLVKVGKIGLEFNWKEIGQNYKRVSKKQTVTG